jgi:gliding motility-associated lipoprotein GldJ
MKKLINFSVYFLMAGMLVTVSSCSEKSSRTGWKYNDKKNGGFQVYKDAEQATGPGLIFVEGGTFVMGSMEQDLAFDNDNYERRVSVSSFYMDETEVTNVDYCEYLYWLKRVYGADYPEVYNQALPDTLAWRNPLGFNEPYVDNYLRHPAYKNYPVVGVSWTQANEYCAWRTDRVNERILIDKGILKDNPNQVNEDNFSTQAYLSGQYEGMVKKNLKNLDPNGEPTRRVRLEDGILLPNYRLPTESEWEYAAKALKGNSQFENVNQKRLYAWNGLTTRDPEGKGKGIMYANYKRGRGDNMGVAGYLNDSYDITGPVRAFVPNDFGLYNMAGNVSEWVMDVYRPLSPEDKSDFNPFRGNVYTKPATDADGNIAEKDSLGHVKRVVDYDAYASPDKRGDIDDESMYAYGVTSMINNKARVYKGGSWNDRAYFLNPGVRRFMDEDASTSDIGFRCAMVRLGSQDAKKFKARKPNK